MHICPVVQQVMGRAMQNQSKDVMDRVCWFAMAVALATLSLLLWVF
jgi:hypothetical protein